MYGAIFFLSSSIDKIQSVFFTVVDHICFKNRIFETRISTNGK